MSRTDLLRLPHIIDPAEFARKYFPHHCRYSFNPMHTFSFEKYMGQASHILPSRQGRRLAIAAPRGAAKSTIHSMLLPLIDLLYQRERHIIIVSATLQQATNRIGNITRELLTNKNLHHAFFDDKKPVMISNRRSIELNGVRIEAFGAGGEMRGVSFGEYRPTRIILDDVEASRNAVRPAGRAQLMAWYDEVVENLGDNYTHVTIVGTILHANSLLSTLLDRPGYDGRIYKSISMWSKRTDLWQRWQQLYSDRCDPDRAETADGYFLENKAAMQADTEVLWPAKEDYLRLQQQLITVGRAAFFKEKQNTPFSSEGRIFDTSRWTRFIAPEGRVQILTPAISEAVANDLEAVEGTAVMQYQDPGHKLPLLEELKCYGFLDPAMGKRSTRDGDFAAIVTVGRDLHGNVYVLDVWMERCSPSMQIKRVFDLHQVYKYALFGYEANGFQEMLSRDFARESKEQRERGRAWQIPYKLVTNTGHKRERIACLEPQTVCGAIKFQQNLPEEFFNQADEFGPGRGHDDALDALASCMEMIYHLDKGIGGMRTVKRKGRGRF